jgi:hypothetical protein
MEAKTYKCPNSLLYHPQVDCDWIVCGQAVHCYACGCYWEDNRVTATETDAAAVIVVAESCTHTKTVDGSFQTCLACGVSTVLS